LIQIKTMAKKPAPPAFRAPDPHRFSEGIQEGNGMAAAEPKATHGRAVLPSRLLVLRQVAIRQHLA